MLLLGLKHNRQQRESDCLIACCTMVLTYLQIPTGYDRLARLLDLQEFGAFFSRLRNLSALGLMVQIGDNASLTVFEQFIDLGLPVIVPVRTWTLLYWEMFDTDHAIVVVGIDIANELIYVHDPFFAEAPIAVSFDEFEPAWTEMGRRYAVIGLAEI